MHTRSAIVLSLFATLCTTLSGGEAFAKNVELNAANFQDAPSWLTRSRAQRVVDRAQNFLEWDIRKVTVHAHPTQEAFNQVHSYGDSVLAISLRGQNTIHLGPRVTNDNFDAIFGHELTHIILHQKYAGAVPQWLEEGLANYVGKQGRVDYRWLSTQPKFDIRSLGHPFAGKKGAPPSIEPRLHYQASTAAIEMLAAACDLRDLLQLSVGKKLETYIERTCGISDINSHYQTWLVKKSK
jgi:hypothetical protein